MHCLPAESHPGRPSSNRPQSRATVVTMHCPDAPLCVTHIAYSTLKTAGVQPKAGDRIIRRNPHARARTASGGGAALTGV